jgi:hypothetical protein
LQARQIIGAGEAALILANSNVHWRDRRWEHLLEAPFEYLPGVDAHSCIKVAR